MFGIKLWGELWKGDKIAEWQEKSLEILDTSKVKNMHFHTISFNLL